jgi:hypothetical protein
MYFAVHFAIIFALSDNSQRLGFMAMAFGWQLSSYAHGMSFIYSHSVISSSVMRWRYTCTNNNKNKNNNNDASDRNNSNSKNKQTA